LRKLFSEVQGSEILAVGEAERVKKPKLPRKRLLKRAPR